EGEDRARLATGEIRRFRRWPCRLGMTGLRPGTLAREFQRVSTIRTHPRVYSLELTGQQPAPAGSRPNRHTINGSQAEPSEEIGVIGVICGCFPDGCADSRSEMLGHARQP